MSTVPAPLRSPEPPQIHESPTGEYPVVKRELRRELALNELKTVAAIVVASLGIVFGAWRVVISEAKAQTDAGVALVELKQAATQAQLDRYERESAARLDRVEAQGTRTDAKLDALLTAFRVPNPAPTPKDGGQ